MKSSNPKNKKPDIYLKIALAGSFGMFVLCLTFCLASFQFRGTVESQRMHPTLTPELYKNALDMMHFSYFIALPAMGFCNLVIGSWIWKYCCERKRIERLEMDTAHH